MLSSLRSYQFAMLTIIFPTEGGVPDIRPYPVLPRLRLYIGKAIIPCMPLTFETGRSSRARLQGLPSCRILEGSGMAQPSARMGRLAPTSAESSACSSTPTITTDFNDRLAACRYQAAGPPLTHSPKCSLAVRKTSQPHEQPDRDNYFLNGCVRL